MKQIVLPALLLALAACSAPTAPVEKPAEQAAAPAPASALVGLAGRWALTVEGCAATNTARDGVIEIGAGTVQVGLDTCVVTKETPEPSEVTRFTVDAKCAGGEGGAYERPFTFVSSSPDTMTWVDEGGTAEPYLRCK
jgi:hypothetical protein